MKRFVSIGFIWFGCAVAWVILGGTITARTGESSGELQREVHLLWGPPLEQRLPRAFHRQLVKRKEKVTSVDARGQALVNEVEREEEREIDLALDASDIGARLTLEHRRKGLLWFPTYGVDFNARYVFHNNTAAPHTAELEFPLGGEGTVYDGFAVTDGTGKKVEVVVQADRARWITELAAGERREYRVRYRSRGTSRWGYQLTAGTGEVRNFRLVLDTDFPAVDFPAGTLSPSRHQAAAGAWHGEWTFTSLVAGAPIGLELPQRVNPGPLAQRITFFAPVGLLFFFFVVAILATARRRRLHPQHYFFLGCAFFAFHLLFAYLVDHLAILPSFAIASLTSIFLVVSYARLFVGWAFALREMGIAQILYLVLFSYTFLFPGFTGLAITIGAILTLFVMMQVMGRVGLDGDGPTATSPRS